MSKDKIDINIGCGHVILSIFKGVALVITVIGIFIGVFLTWLLS